MSASPQHVIVGRVRNVHGLKGELVIESHTDEPDAVFASGRRVYLGNVRGKVEDAPRTIDGVRPFKGGYIVKLSGVDDRNDAELLRERFVFLEDSELSPLGEGEIYLHELDGMRVERENGELVGKVIALYELPQGLMLDVSREGGKSIIIPYDRVVTSVDREAKVIRIDPPEGMIE